MVSVVFDPAELTIDASLNHVMIGSYGCREVAGWRAEDACSRDAFWALATDLGVPGLRPGWLLDDLASARASNDGRTCRAVDTALWTFGRRLGALIATLRDPATPGDQARNPARHAYLSYWLSIDSIWLAGGLFASGLGDLIMQGVQAGATAAALPCQVTLSRHPALASLIGAARLANGVPSQHAIAVADLGHTRIKTAIAHTSPAGLHGLRLLDTYAAPAHSAAAEIEQAVAAPLARLARLAAGDEHRDVRLIASLASFVRDGVPVDDGQGTYGCLATRLESLRRHITKGSGLEVTLQFVHDGTAAACAADSANCATITAGTWLGAGFRAPKAAPLLAASPDLRIGLLSPFSRSAGS